MSATPSIESDEETGMPIIGHILGLRENEVMTDPEWCPDFEGHASVIRYGDKDWAEEGKVDHLAETEPSRVTLVYCCGRKSDFCASSDPSAVRLPNSETAMSVFGSSSLGSGQPMMYHLLAEGQASFFPPEEIHSTICGGLANLKLDGANASDAPSASDADLLAYTPITLALDEDTDLSLVAAAETSGELDKRIKSNFQTLIERLNRGVDDDSLTTGSVRRDEMDPREYALFTLHRAWANSEAKNDAVLSTSAASSA
jgi:hypothetical protein